jgi:hypothetical protein
VGTVLAGCPHLAEGDIRALNIEGGFTPSGNTTVGILNARWPMFYQTSNLETSFRRPAPLQRSKAFVCKRRWSIAARVWSPCSRKPTEQISNQCKPAGNMARRFFFACPQPVVRSMAKVTKITDAGRETGPL